jgi:hypothetical protein
MHYTQQNLVWLCFFNKKNFIYMDLVWIAKK